MEKPPSQVPFGRHRRRSDANAASPIGTGPTVTGA